MCSANGEGILAEVRVEVSYSFQSKREYDLIRQWPISTISDYSLEIVSVFAVRLNLYYTQTQIPDRGTNYAIVQMTMVHVFSRPGKGVGGRYSHIWATRVCAAQQFMLFATLTLEQGIKITLSLWKRVYFTLGLTLEQAGSIFPRILNNHDKV